MEQPVTPISTDLVLLGGGHSHALVLRQLGMVELPGVRITLISDRMETPYSGMLPAHIAGRYSLDQSHIDLRPLTRFANCRLYLDQVIGVDTERQQVLCAHHPPVAFDLLSIDTGSTPATVEVPGAREYSIPAKPVPELLQGWHRLLQAVQAHPGQSWTLAVVGGGVGGVELVLNMQDRLHHLLADLGQPPDRLTLHLFHRGQALAPDRHPLVRQRLGRILQRRGIQVHLGEAVVQLDRPDPAGPVQIEGQSGRVLRCDRVFWVTSAAAPAWLQGSGLALDDQGFIQVGDTLQTLSHPNVFATGDVATMVHHPRPKAGVFAVRQGKPLYHNLLRFLQHQPLQPFHPQRQFLTLIDLGYGRTLAARGPWSWESALCRRWKDRIDQRFMARLREFPAMAPHQIRPRLALSPSPAPPLFPCGGCGAKVGSDALTLAIQRVREDFPDFAAGSDDLLIGLDAPDDAAVINVPAGQVMVHTVDFFPAMVDDPFLFAQICLKHCLSDLYAMGAKPHSVLAMVQIPYGTPAKQADTLYPLLVGIHQGLLATGAPLVGGHSSQASQLGLGLACNGVADPDRLLRKGGMGVGDGLILTQPLGTGTLFAADMRGLARGRWMAAALEQMVQSNQAAAALLQAHQATACTDVTGFGLIGHLLEMVRASRVSVQLDLGSLPVLTGARETLAQGIVSSLQPQNLESAQAIANRADYEVHPDYPLLFDPQTAGGLLAAVPAPQLAACLKALREQGYGAATAIGQVTGKDSAQPIIINSG
ncbi:MAG: selenide, water dikinase SelD [Cyanobacteriota bacterium]|nr:selenide, water dikinase SelD [Cyanobacteriota bacterium]